jgi:predicted  nucleic acid-binding Zn-ribbon protein
MAAEVHQILLQEARAEIGTLRNDLYATRRVAEERRQSEAALSKAKAALEASVAALEAQLRDANDAARQLPGLQAELQSSQQRCAQLERDVDLAVRARRILEQELQGEDESGGGLVRCNAT